MESFEDFGLKIGLYSWLIKIVYEDSWVQKVKVIIWPLTHDSQSTGMTISNISILNSHWPNCYQISTSLLGLREQIFFQTVEITWQAQPSCPNIVKYFQNLLQNQLADVIDNWYVASGTLEIPRVGRKTLRNQPNQVQDPIHDQDCSNNDLGLTLTFLYGLKHRKMLIYMISWTVLKTFAQEFLMMT